MRSDLGNLLKALGRLDEAKVRYIISHLFENPTIQSKTPQKNESNDN